MSSAIAGIFMFLGIGILLAHAMDAFRSAPRLLAITLQKWCARIPLNVEKAAYWVSSPSEWRRTRER